MVFFGAVSVGLGSNLFCLFIILVSILVSIRDIKSLSKKTRRNSYCDS